MTMVPSVYDCSSLDKKRTPKPCIRDRVPASVTL